MIMLTNLMVPLPGESNQNLFFKPNEHNYHFHHNHKHIHEHNYHDHQHYHHIHQHNCHIHHNQFDGPPLPLGCLGGLLKT